MPVSWQIANLEARQADFIFHNCLEKKTNPTLYLRRVCVFNCIVMNLNAVTEARPIVDFTDTYD